MFFVIVINGKSGNFENQSQLQWCRRLRSRLLLVVQAKLASADVLQGQRRRQELTIVTKKTTPVVSVMDKNVKNIVESLLQLSPSGTNTK